MLESLRQFSPPAFLSSMLLNEVQKWYRHSQQQADIIKTQQQEINQLKVRLSRIEKMLSGGTSSGDDRASGVQGNEPIRARLAASRCGWQTYGIAPKSKTVSHHSSGAT